MAEIIHPEVFTAIFPAIEKAKAEFPGVYHTPLWGTKNTPNIKNLGMVIGYHDPARSQWYRVDWDPEKGLHINYERDTADPRGRKFRFKKCFRIRPHIRDPRDEMYDWWRSTTLHHCTELPDDIKQKMGGKGVFRGAFWTKA